ncbi:spore protease YyaC [Clostridium algidicarnis]|uniref:spore protease YyaC n=1 Tax=Clostridium algidicarnis TaxID=37659 RepID=UPI00162422D7|nr:spore protease YyaC [Clostridium algidicarnis]MBB6629919.1 spore protease YyaC [Clostridium algidicarnis]MBU3197303.1 spore protease YyaC [Clostridium algidicarnis]MCB2287689.1 spore protease YyaC [Clostridium algidicarnis]
MIENLSFDSNDKRSVVLISNYLSNIISNESNKGNPIVFLCIGTDRSIGDSLGPLVGNKLNLLTRNNLNIYGTLKNPIHAKNLAETMNEINTIFDSPYIIAIDACLGKLNSVGNIFINNGPLYPGTALNKNLPAVGNLSITGIVNINSSIDFMILQNTRLYNVMKLADVISTSIHQAIIKSDLCINGSRMKLHN